MAWAKPYRSHSILVWCASIAAAACREPLCQASAEAVEHNCRAERCEEDQVILLQLSQQPQPAQSSSQRAGPPDRGQRPPGGQRQQPLHERGRRADAAVGLLAEHRGQATFDLEHAVKYVYPVFAVGALIALAIINRSRGPVAMFVILLFLCDFAAIKLIFTWVMVDFPFPVFVTMVAFMLLACVTLIILTSRCCFLDVPFLVPTRQEFTMLLLPSCLGYALSATCMNMALTYTTASFAEMLGSTSCFSASLLTVLVGLPFHLRLLLPMTVVAFGAVAATAGVMTFSLIGFLLVLASNGFQCFQSVLQQKLMMIGDRSVKYDPCSVAFWGSIPSSCLLFGLGLATEGVEPFRYLAAVEPSHRLSYSLEVILFCTLFVCMQLTGTFVVREVGGVGFQVMAMGAGMLTVGGGIFFLGEHVTMLQLAGYFVMLVGVAWFNSIQNMSQSLELERESKKKREADRAA
eukprot:CAMPEP_0115263074 /NCGR_PEP_ID=MMETSP0270-20121206/49721_1 /TAXON_ID=71861 /ORGANISM="Scrippsiella trochoidea, Strain CCMP3099" /LENGTH=461 /DNA_ID=CAMNT_0002679041 /DNA_START=14 /DNA_END=1395 /DNA_ORIENTATION=-